MTGMVSALGGIIWGNLLGVDMNLALVGFKVFPVVILGGLDSIPGAHHRRAHRRHRRERRLRVRRFLRGGGTKDFAPYVLMIMALMVGRTGSSARRSSRGYER